MKTIKIIAAVGLLAATLPVAAQTQTPDQSVAAMDRLMRADAVRLGTLRLSPQQAKPAYQGKVNLDERKDPWRPVTSAQMSQLVQDPYLKKAAYSLRVMVDFNGDGHMDVAQAYNNSKQGAVIVTFGGPKPRPPLVAFKMDARFDAGEEILAAGRNRVAVYIPDARTHLLFMDRSGPKVYTMGE